MIDEKLLQIIRCPKCKSDLKYDKLNNKLICYLDKLAYPIIDNIPILIINEAEKIKGSN